MAVVKEAGRILYPVVVQHASTLQILMCAFADDEALTLTKQTHRAHFYSRSRQELWEKGRTSGNYLTVSQVLPDCDGDSFLYLVTSDKPACHRGSPSCFDNTPQLAQDPNPLGRLRRYIQEREHANPAESYTARLLNDPLEKLLKKIGEEAIEVIVAAATDSQTPGADLVWETTDLLYHLSVLLMRSGISLDTLDQELIRRHHEPSSATPQP
ncbi:MAG: bifunctional phosphoribosyl-AMP cyclohydrolase/phosphoribosyl-ATP diphosphatase HisIE [Firmicutes bacterium]|uniref:Histidine biosynthesis bifunctional protein HisIE n=1 Tax=Sulfobacillus benefaciens TaxID=453960 RepID=A0A2T2X896_9FIRM|nr:bifunctional phosphoribosyl-AMP cyclohydrolase/phosphoribosyl-ATP diphosphatase HisIE [Bacillota bacterium]MCL5012548.1 bifunctional phosphoribosyl-AMP cyclohydrolase/phosphoribosyl-ATP diphosphatase HisIE [Bacillota bacterium]PSR30676.1 MAG: phosphoribosyl-AMP cyclohydrolase [Sulfobacillus benefaciens]